MGRKTPETAGAARPQRTGREAGTAAAVMPETETAVTEAAVTPETETAALVTPVTEAAVPMTPEAAAPTPPETTPAAPEKTPAFPTAPPITPAPAAPAAPAAPPPPQSRVKILRQLFFATLYISAFTFGGGFVIVTFMKKKFVDAYHWIDEDEMLDLTALAQSAPGAIAVNAAILVGWRVAGFAGMVTAVAGTVLPPLVLLCVISLFYSAFAASTAVALFLKGMRAGVAAVILDVVCGLGGSVLKKHSWVNTTVMAAAFLAAFVWGVPVLWIILAAAAIGITAEACRTGRAERAKSAGDGARARHTRR